MSDFQTDQNRSELVQSPLNLTSRRNNENKQSTDIENDLNYNDTFSSYNSMNNLKLKNNAENFAQHQFILSDNNFTLTERIENDYETFRDEEQHENDEEHTVGVTVTILAAFPTEKESEKEMSIPESINKPRPTEGPKPINFYKFEYQLTPDDPETLYSADLVTYKSAVKIFPEKSEPKVIKAWENQNRIWVTWNISHELKLTKSRLLKLFEHEIILKIWDSKDYCSARTKFDKPKPFKFSKSGENAEDNVKSLIIEQCDKYLKQIPVELHAKLDKQLPNQTRAESPMHRELNDRMTNTLIAIPSHSVLSQTLGNKLNELASDTEMNKNVKSKNIESHTRNLSKMSKVSSSDISGVKTPKNSKHKEKTKREIAAELDYIKKHGVTRIKLKTKVLFAGYPYLMTRLEDPLISSIDDCFMSVNIDNSLMSEQQLHDLNPLTIKIEKATSLPNKPLSYESLRDQCEKVYCSYNFFKQKSYKTSSISHDKNIFFNDVNVYLAGLLNRDEMSEFLHQAPFELEIHDRDRKAVRHQPLKPCLFGNDAVDDQISSVNSVASKHTLYNPFETKDKRWDPYGVAKLNLYELVLGKKLVEFFVPVLPCIAPDVLGRNATKISSNTKVLGNDDSPMSVGQYLDCNTHLNVKITVAKPLFEYKKTRSHKNDKTCVFGRVILKIDSTKLNIIRSIIQTVRDINARGLQFSNHPVEVQDAALSTYKLNEEELESKTLDIVTGFHLIDAKCIMFVLEGLKDSGIKLIYEKIPSSENECEVLYNSSMSFSKRLYSILDVELIKIKLFEPLEQIVKKPILYVRDMTPKISFEALIKLNQLLSEFKLRDVVRCDLLPTAQMILSMSKEFGVPLTENELKQFKLKDEATENKENLYNPQNSNENSQGIMDEFGYGQNANIPHTSRIWTPIDNYNDNFMTQKSGKDTVVKNHISNNKKIVHETSEQNRVSKPVQHYITADSAFNYSSQALNSTELALNKFRELINQKTPKQLYSYNPEYNHSMTFVPANIKQEEKDSLDKSKDEWKTKEGWIFPDVKTSMQSNEHPRKLDQASLDKINEPWEENVLHAYKMKSPLDRIFFKHSIRDADFDVWKQPKVENIFPVTIFESGDTKERLEKEVSKEEKENWMKKVIVDNTEIKIHKLSPATEMKFSGFDASNQIDRLTGLLKSEPIKNGLLTGGVNFNKIPALSAVKTEYEDKQTRFVNSKGFIAGSDPGLRITDDKNRIPVHYHDHASFIKTKGKDFDLNGPARSPIYKRSVDLLKFEDKDHKLPSQMFIIPNKSDLDNIERLSFRDNLNNRQKNLLI